MSRSLQQRCGLVVACCRVGGTECSRVCMGPFKGGPHYLHYLHHRLASAQITGRDTLYHPDKNQCPNSKVFPFSCIFFCASFIYLFWAVLFFFSCSAGFSPAAVHSACASLRCLGFSSHLLLWLRDMGSGVCVLSGCGPLALTNARAP